MGPFTGLPLHRHFTVPPPSSRKNFFMTPTSRKTNHHEQARKGASPRAEELLLPCHLTFRVRRLISQNFREVVHLNMFNMFLTPFNTLNLVYSPPVSTSNRRNHIPRKRRQLISRHRLTNHQRFKHNSRQRRSTHRHLSRTRQFSINGQAVRRRVTQARRVKRVNILIRSSVNLTHRRAPNTRLRVLLRQPDANSRRLGVTNITKRQRHLSRHGLVFLTNRSTEDSSARQRKDQDVQVNQLLQ